MLIVTAPIVLPVSTAHPPTEAVAIEAAKKVPVPKATPATNNQNTRHSTENHEQPKNSLDLNRQIEQKNSGDGQQSNSNKESSEQQNKQDNEQQQQKQQAKELAQQAQDQRIVEQLKNIDREVRAHEAAHASVGGQLAGAPQLDFTTGPDGKRYAVSGEVSINTSKVANDPQATINKMSQVRNAALAPANPSPQDLKVAAIASQVANQAQVEINVARNQQTKIDKSQDKKDESQQKNNLADKDISSKPRDIIFVNPIVARRSSFQLNQKITNSGALDDYNQKPLISHSA